MNDYIVSARKYRPVTFDTVVGQSSLTTTLKRSIQTGHLAHAYLFCGPRGVGKTTCARIFAKNINCMSPTADGEPCGECESCKAFNEQRSLNIYELDAASNNGVEEIKKLIEQTRIPPQVGKYKVFIIDEVHMLSNQAFNAFLKTLEEPPHYVIFILATTEKHKLLPTIISRCQIYDFNRMTVQDTVAHLQKVAENEGITAEVSALTVIAEKADGGMRDALSIFDQVTAFCGGNITYQQTIANLNVLDHDYYFKLVDYFLGNKVADIMVLFNDVINHGFEGSHFINGLNTHLRNLLMCQDAKTASLLDTNDEVRNRYCEQAKKCKSQFLYTAIRYCTDCDINYKISQNKRLLVEITLIEIAQSCQEDGVSSGRRPAKKLKPLFNRVAAKVQVTAPSVQQPAVKVVPQPGGSISSTVNTVKPAPAVASGNGGVAVSVAVANGNSNPAKAAVTDIDDDTLRYTLRTFAHSLRNVSPSMEAFLFRANPIPVNNNTIELSVDNPAQSYELNRMLPNLQNWLAKGLNKPQINVIVKLSELAPVEILSKAQLYAKLKENNPALVFLEKELKLRL